MFKHLLWVILLTSFSIPTAQALVFFEPLVGYSTGSLSIDATDTFGSGQASDELDIKGLKLRSSGWSGIRKLAASCRLHSKQSHSFRW